MDFAIAACITAASIAISFYPPGARKLLLYAVKD